MKSKLMRINMELAMEIENLAKKNDVTVTAASREIAKMVRRLKIKGKEFEIKF